jgi:hypothetical protein
MSCHSCKKCYELADGTTLVRIEDRNGVRHYEVAGAGVITTTAPANMVYTKEIPCAKFDEANVPATSITVLEEVDASGNQTGKLVHVVQNADGSISQTDLSTGGAYTLPAGYVLHTSEDAGTVVKTEALCDQGVTVFRTTMYSDTDLTDVKGTLITKLDGSAHTLSGNETAGDCNSNKVVDVENNVLFGDPNDPSIVPVMGYIRSTTDLNTMVTTTDYFASDDSPIAAGLEPVVC